MKLTERTFTKFASHATLAAVLIPPRAGRAAVLQNLVATSDKAASVIQFYDMADAIHPTASAASGQADFKVALNAIEANDLLVIHNPGVDAQTQLVAASSVADATETTVTAAANLNFAITTNTQIFKLTAGASIPLGAATKEYKLAPGALVVGGEQKPLLIRVDGTAACSIGLASGEYAE